MADFEVSIGQPQSIALPGDRVPVLRGGVATALDLGAALAAPNIYPDIPVFKPPAYGYTGMGAAINASIAAAISSGRNAMKIVESNNYCDVPVVLPLTPFTIVGLGRQVPGAKGEGYGGGVRLQQPYGAATSAVRLPGTYSAGSLSGFGQYTRIENIGFGSNGQSSGVFGATGGPVPIFDIKCGYKIALVECSFTADYVQALRITNTWDSDFDNISIFSAGSSDPTATSDTTAVRGYTGRNFMACETLIGRSLGVPALEIISPNTDGNDVCNVLRFKSYHHESNGTNGVPLMLRGGNGNNIRFAAGSKIEARDGCNPMIVLQDQSSFQWDGYLRAAGSGSAPAVVGSIAGGTAWKAYPSPGIVLAHSCTSPKFFGAIGYDGGGSAVTSLVQAFLRFVNTIDPQSNMSVTAGLDSLQSSANGGARQIFDNCLNVSTARTRAFASAYILGIAGANTVERTTPNGTTTEA